MAGHSDENAHTGHGAGHGNDEDERVAHDDHGLDEGHADAGHGEPFVNNAPEVSGQVMTNWWKFPFDQTTNFSLLGYFLGRIFDRERQDKRVDMTLNG